MSQLDSNLNTAQELFDRFYMEGDCRAFFFAAEFQLVPGEQDTLDVGDPPKNYKKAEAINDWFVNKRAEVAVDPAQTLFTGEPHDCVLVNEGLDKITESPLVMLELINMILMAGGIVLGYSAPQRLKALAAWAASQDVKSQLVAWRRSFGARVPSCCLSDPLDFLLSSTGLAANGARLIRALGLSYPTDRRSWKQMLDIKKIVDTLLSQSLTESYYELNGDQNG